MKLEKIVEFLDEFLDVANIQDLSLNGLQFGDNDREINKIYFAVDASLKLFKKAQKGSLIIVHHGLFWGKPFAITGIHHRRYKELFDRDLALYAAHLPLDMHSEIGHNAQIAEKLGLKDIEPFGSYKGKKIGFSGKLPSEEKREDFLHNLEELFDGIRSLEFGKEKISTVAIVSGGAADLIPEAMESDIDLYITGESSHSMYHFALEGGLNVVYAGHYSSEVFGLKRLRQLLNEKFGIESEFVHIPTGF